MAENPNWLSTCLVMVIGITAGLDYAYAAKTVTTSEIYIIVWECIECTEIVAGSKVLFICCGGVTHNRRFFIQHDTTSRNRETTFKTVYPILLAVETFILETFILCQIRHIYRSLLVTVLPTLRHDIFGTSRALAAGFIVRL